MSNNLAANAHDLKSRLEWGQPAFTIIDVRDRYSYNYAHISGAIQIPIDDLEKRATFSLHKERHIYVYGDNEQQTAKAAQILRSAGFTAIAEIEGGFIAWKTVGGAIEGVAA